MSDTPPTTKHVVMFSGGGGSWAAAKRIAERHGTENLILLFTDTLMEDSDLYRFLVESACNVFGEAPPTQFLSWLRTLPEFHEDRIARKLMLEIARADMAEILPGLVWIAEGRDPWEVFRDRRMLGNSRLDPCSDILKRQPADKWLRANCDPANTVVYLGIDWTEEHRYDDSATGGATAIHVQQADFLIGENDDAAAVQRGPGGAKHRYARNGWVCKAPMCEAPYWTKRDILALMDEQGIRRSKMYENGAPHDNCSGMCVKAGQGHFAWLLRTFPSRYECYEGEENKMRDFLGRDVAMMADTRNGGKTPLTMTALRERIEAEGQVDMFEIGGCGCFSDG